jgi:hypothetical protein
MDSPLSLPLSMYTEVEIKKNLAKSSSILTLFLVELKQIKRQQKIIFFPRGGKLNIKIVLC